MNHDFFKVHEVLSESLETQTCRASLVADGKACIVRQVKTFKENDDVLKKLQEEYNTWIKLSHDGFLSLIAAQITRPGAAIILEDPGYEQLSSYYLKGALRPYEAVKVIYHLLEAIAFLHQKEIVLQTLTASDILFDRSTGKVKIICLEKRLPLDEELYEEENQHVLNELLMYTDPAIIVQPNAVPDGRSDLYSIGVMLYELLFFRSLFGYSNFREIISAHLMEKPYFSSEELKKLPASLIDFVLTLLAKKPRSRFSSAAEALNELSKIMVQIKALIEN